MLGLEVGADDYVTSPSRRRNWWHGCAPLLPVASRTLAGDESGQHAGTGTRSPIASCRRLPVELTEFRLLLSSRAAVTRAFYSRAQLLDGLGRPRLHRGSPSMYYPSPARSAGPTSEYRRIQDGARVRIAFRGAEAPCVVR